MFILQEVAKECRKRKKPPLENIQPRSRCSPVHGRAGVTSSMYVKHLQMQLLIYVNLQYYPGLPGYQHLSYERNMGRYDKKDHKYSQLPSY
ncbi:hypothetical protein Y1Q_0015192 [Alligator mississippiensis]|uniref:Uncharacterized protein n=1 Tax=Alligator mississippiensis TaxID=8496 RepID=A0A151P943_ALLMI|nr:hypothetical protein Y1Q_0015192 [Alligator mississippiensis]